MNITHLRYAVEVEKAKSINKAAENLYMGQPNLSRAIKELEEELGITIFNRSSRGMTITTEGEEFLSYAHRILEQVNEVETIYKTKKHNRKKFTVSVPRASYISYAFSQFTKAIDTTDPVEIYYKETNSSRAITNLLQNDYKLAILRYQDTFDEYFKNLIEEKDLESRLITEFSYRLMVNRNSPLAAMKKITPEDLSDYIEIVHADPYVPSLPYIDVMRKEFADYTDKRINLFERASQFELMAENERTFMWVSPIQKSLLERYNLVEIECDFHSRKYRDVLVYRKGYTFTELDNLFIEKLEDAQKEIMR